MLVKNYTRGIAQICQNEILFTEGSSQFLFRGSQVDTLVPVWGDYGSWWTL